MAAALYRLEGGPGRRLRRPAGTGPGACNPSLCGLHGLGRPRRETRIRALLDEIAPEGQA
ncbi:hypothetical protein ACFTZK_12375 [Streptomyces decoyicus]|uniref:hypothetical protein n=1 Tax=Streptomyces decoyicus TaxID=249567 RepID=UPI003625FA60